MSIEYSYSYGRLSKFFRELRDNKRIFGTKCPNCGTVYCPPRPDCNKCYVEAEWIELSGKGKVYTFTTCYWTVTDFVHQVPYIISYVKLDESDTAILQRLINVRPEDVKIGMRVQAVFKDDREGKISDFAFEPIEK